MARPLTRLSDAELREALDQEAQHVVYSYNGVVAELDRRSRNRQALASLVLSVVGVVIAVIALVVTAIRA
jgi:hypothetical protein